MSAKITRFVSRQQRLTDEQAFRLRDGLAQLSLEMGLPHEATSDILSTIDRRTAASEGWTFVMLSPRQNSLVVKWLGQNSQRPQVAMQLWALCFTALRNDTGEICLSRQELADELGIRANNVSSIMTELKSINAISARKVGRSYRYFMNPNVGTQLPGEARDKAQAEFGQLRLV